MPQAETLTDPRPSEIDANLDPQIESAPPEVVNTLGHIALEDEAYLDEEFNRIQDYANGESVSQDSRVRDVEAAHEAALLENKLFDIAKAHEAALRENEIFDAHVAALKENEERDAAIAKAQLAVETARQDEVIPEPEPTTKPDQETMRNEVAAKLNEAGIDMRLPPTSRVTKDAVGNILILDGTDAKLITQSVDGSSKLIDYQYDDEKGTVTIDGQPFSALDHSTDYQETPLQNWQTHGEVVTLPPAIAHQFGIERVIKTTH